MAGGNVGVPLRRIGEAVGPIASVKVLDGGGVSGGVAHNKSQAQIEIDDKYAIATNFFFGDSKR